MKHFYTESSTRIHAVSYFEDTQELLIEFRRGGVYKYFGVPEDVYILLVNAQSIGKAINQFVKGRFSYERVTK